MFEKTDETKTIAINSYAPNTIEKLMPFNSFELKLLIYPKYRGIQKLTGVYIKNKNTDKRISLGILGEFLVVGK